ncbi:MAG: ADP-ribosylglycohydrolase family protein [Deltaproteobacteria bacterium]|nr:ADP-ribosylglycohydrolase family protein [Deltaproteobacteria bacterium]
MESIQRYRGALLGLAAGDALGTTLEFRPPGSFEPIADMVGGGPFRLRPGEWTDDTSMALCLAASLVERRGFDARDQMERYVRWWRTGYLSSNGRCFDIGNAVRAALSRFERSGEPLAGSTDANSAGNGALMRLAPVALAYASDARAAVHHCGQSSRTTHGVRDSIDACRYFGGLIVAALQGRSKDELLAPGFAPFGGGWADAPLSSAIAEIAAGSFKRRQPPAIRGSGHVVRALEAALWALHGTSSFRDGALRAVNLGDDADTTGAIYGQLAGALYGEEAIPTEWRKRLAKRDLIEHLAGALHALASDAPRHA